MERLPRPPETLVERESGAVAIEVGVMGASSGCTVRVGVAIHSGASEPMWTAIDDLFIAAM